MRLSFFALAAAICVPLPAVAAPLCVPAREGEVACLDGKLCRCRHDPGGALAGRRAGTRWDCGALRPSCGQPAPADLGGGGGASEWVLPPPFAAPRAPHPWR